jgi:hypothetical protein
MMISYLKSKKDTLLTLLYCASSLSLAFFCLIHSYNMSHDQQARDLAGKSLHMENQARSQNLLPLATQRSLKDIKRKLGEEKSD